MIHIGVRHLLEKCSSASAERCVIRDLFAEEQFIGSWMPKAIRVEANLLSFIVYSHL